jgi:hypothetical protein
MSLSNTDHTHQRASGVVASFSATPTSSSKQKPLFDSESEISVNDNDDDNDSITNVSVHTAQTVLPDVHEEDGKPGYEYNYKLSTVEDMIDSHRHYSSTSHGSSGGHTRSLTAVVISPTASSLSTEDTNAKLPEPRAINLTRSPSNVLNSDAYREAVARFR